MFYFILIILPISISQKLLLDSRVNQLNLVDLELFNEEFSIWFTTQRNNDDSDIFSIIQNRRVIIRLSSYVEELKIYEKNKLIQTINYEQFDHNNQWYHVIITQQDQQVLDLFLQQGPKIYSSVSFNTQALKNETKIFSNKNKNYFCLIYDSITKDVQPNIHKIVFNTFTMPWSIDQVLYFSNSTAIIFLRKFQQQFQKSHLLSLLNGEYELMLIEDQNNIFVIFDDGIQFLGTIYEQSFMVQIEIYMEKIQIGLQNNMVQYETPKVCDSIFYSLQLPTQSNYQHQQMLITYKTKVEDVDKSLFDIQCEIDQFYDVDNQICLNLEQIYTVKLIEDQETQLQLSIILTNNKSRQIRDRIFQEILMQLNVDDTEQTIFIKQYTDVQNVDSKEIYVLYKSVHKTICQQFYFGSNCKQFIRNCIFMNQNNQLACRYGYININHKCKKCPKGCLICTYGQHTLKCPLSIKKYYINKFGQTKICKCEYCNYKGECLSISDVEESIHTCQQNAQCLLKLCKLGEYFNIKTQQCSILPQDVEALLLQNAGDYQYEDIQTIQHQIIQSYLINQDVLSHNEISKLYFGYQLIYNYNILLKKDLSNNQLYIINQYNLKCEEKGIDSVGDIICQQYDNQDLNIQYQFSLELQNVSLCMGRFTNFIIYQQQEYFSLTDLLTKIQDLGVEYSNITIHLHIQFIQGMNLYNYQDTIYIYHDSLPQHFKMAQIHLFIRLPQIQAKISLKLETNVEYVYLFDQILGFDLWIYIYGSEMVQFKNFSTADQIEFDLYGNSIGKVILSDLTIQSKFNLVLKESVNIDINNSEFYIWFHQSIINIQKTEILIISNSNFFYLEMQSETNFQILFSKYILLESVVFIIQLVQDIIVLRIGQVDDIIMKNIQINAENLFMSKIISITLSKRTLIDGFKNILQNNSQNVFYQINSKNLQIQNFNIFAKEVQEANYLTIISDYVMLKFFTYILDYSNQNTLLIIQANTLEMENFTLIQDYNKTVFKDDNKTLKLYNYSIQFKVDYGSLDNFYISGVRLQNYGLMHLYVSEEMRISDLLIENILFQQDSLQLFIQFQEYLNNPNYFLQNITIRNIKFLVINENTLININNAVLINILNITLDHIHSWVDMGQILRILSSQANIFYLTVTNCYGSNLMEVQSAQFMLSYFKYFNNTQFRLFRLQTQTNRICIIKNAFFGQSLIHNELIYAIKLLNPPFKIILSNIVIKQIKSQTYLFHIIGDLLQLKIYDLTIKQQIIEQINFDISTFYIVYSNFYAHNLVIDNIQQPLFRLFEIQQIRLSQICILNINVQLIFFVQILSSSIIIENLQLQNVQNILIILEIIIENQKQYLYLSNLRLSQLYNISQFIQHSQIQDKLQQLKIQNVILTHYDIKYLFVFISHQQQFIKIENLFTNQGKFSLVAGYNNTFLFLNSFIQDVKFKESHLEQVRLKFSEVIGDNLQYIYHLEQSLMYYSINQQRYIRIQSFMTLSIDGGNNLLQTQQLDQTFQIKITQQNATFFYIPSGQKLQQYKRLNLRQLSYQQIYQGLFLIIKGYKIQSDNQKCEQQQYYNDELIQKLAIDLQNTTGSEMQLNIDQIFVINPHNLNFTGFKINCQLNDQNISLKFNVKSFPCQLGEYFYKNQCQLCNASQYQYSVTYNATKCKQVDFKMVKTAISGLIELQKGYWRYKYDSEIIEFCESLYCNGGWMPGDQSCVISRIGALCNECDLYNVRGDGQYTKNNGECTQCQQINIQFVLQFLFAMILQQLFALLAYNSNNMTSNQYLLYKIGFKQFYQILYRQSVDQTQIIIKMYTNYLFMLYVIRQNFDIIGKLFIMKINFMNNPSLIFQAQLQCILQGLTQINVIYSYFFYEILLNFFIISITFTIYTLTILIKKTSFTIGFIIFFMDSVFVYNQKIITETATNLLSYIEISNQKWVKLDIQYLFYSDSHLQMIKFIIPITVTIFIFPMFFPFLLKNLSILSRRAIRIFSIYFQEYRPQLFYWEYCIIYTKYFIMILQIQENQFINITLILIFLIIQASQNLKPYYLQNLNSFESNLFIHYGLHLAFQIQTYFGSVIIICLNLYILFLFIKCVKKSYYLLHIKQIVSHKQKIINFFPRFTNILGINQHLRSETNRKLFLQITRTKIMKKQYIISKSNLHFQLETEIELKSFQPIPNPSVQE